MTSKHPTHLVVDGSNIATEGRSAPSLEQLDEAVRAILEEFPHDRLTVVVDATFGHRIAESERPAYEEAILAGEIVAPPAGAIGRGDAFILQVADKAHATVFSNDSFQEFHGEHEWLFDEGRLIGGKPVPGVGWVFVARVPVRGPLSRRAVRESRRDRTKSGTKRSSRSSSSSSSTATATSESPRRSRPAEGKLTPTTPPPAPPRRREPEDQPLPRSARSTAAADGQPAPSTPRPPIDASEALNAPAVFLAFITRHRIGSVIEATVDHFSSHGAYVIADGARCYLPTKTIGDPPPNRARDVIDRGDVVRVEVQSLDAERRGINVRFVELVESQALAERPAAGLEPIDVAPAAPTVEDEVDDEPIPAHEPRSESDVATKKTAAKRSAVKKAPSGRAVTGPAKKATTKKAAAEATPSPRAVKAAARKAPVKKATSRRASAEAVPEATATAPEAAAPAAPAKRATARGSKKAAATGTKAAAKRATTAKKATATTAKKATGRGRAAAATASDEAAPTTAKRATKRATTKAAGSGEATRTATKRASTTKAAAKKATAATAKKATTKKAASTATAKKATTRTRRSAS